MATLKCSRCSATFGPYPPRHRCSKCGGPLEYVYDLRRLRGAKFTRLRGIWRYASLLPQTEHRVTLGEGGTPLHKAARLTDRLKLKEVYLKDETRNPTNSFRDRSAALMVSNAIDLGYSHVVCASNGNMGASIAAYCAKSGLTAHVIVPRNVDVGKLVQMVMYNARIEEYGDTVDESIVRAERLVEETGWYQATPELNPLTIEAQKTISYEVAEEVGDVGWFIVPVGSGGTLYSIWKGMREAVELGMLESAPKMVGVQARGCSPIVDAHVEGVLKPTPKPATMALGILVRNPLNAELAIRAVKESGGVMVEVSDREILRAERELARLEGRASQLRNDCRSQKAREEGNHQRGRPGGLPHNWGWVEGGRRSSFNREEKAGPDTRAEVDDKGEDSADFSRGRLLRIRNLEEAWENRGEGGCIPTPQRAGRQGSSLNLRDGRQKVLQNHGEGFEVSEGGGRAEELSWLKLK